jgi:hypothetical protein
LSDVIVETLYKQTLPRVLQLDVDVATNTILNTAYPTLAPVITAGVTIEEQGHDQKSIDFDGAGAITFDADPLFQMGTNSFTISSWTRHRNYDNLNSNLVIKNADHCYQENGFAEPYGFEIGHSQSNFGYNICIRDSRGNTVRADLEFDQGYRPIELLNQWKHIVLTFDRDTNEIRAYVNGMLQSNTLDISTITGSLSNGQPLEIGTSYGWTTDGQYDDVIIDRKVWTQQQALDAFHKLDAFEYETLEFDVNNQVTINTNEHQAFDFGTSDSFTLSGWMKYDAQDNFKNIISKRIGGATPGYVLDIRSNGKLAGVLEDGNGNAVITQSNASFDDNQWHFFAWMIDRVSQTSRLYVDGQLERTQAIANIGDISNQESLHIG